MGSNGRESGCELVEEEQNREKHLRSGAEKNTQGSKERKAATGRTIAKGITRSQKVK